MRNLLTVITAIAATMALVGCGGGQKAEAPKPAEPAFAAQVTTTSPMTIASAAMMGPYADFGKTLAVVTAWCENNKVQPAGMPFGVYYDDPAKVKPESAKYEACIPVPEGTKAAKKDKVQVKAMPPMMLAWTDYMGPYDQVGAVYAKLAKWIGENKYEMTGPMVEFYMNDASKVPAESLMTRVAIVVKEAAPAAESAAAAPAGEKPAEKSGK